MKSEIKRIYKNMIRVNLKEYYEQLDDKTKKIATIILDELTNKPRNTAKLTLKVSKIAEIENLFKGVIDTMNEIDREINSGTSIDDDAAQATSKSEKQKEVQNMKKVPETTSIKPVDTLNVESDAIKGTAEIANGTGELSTEKDIKNQEDASKGTPKQSNILSSQTINTTESKTP